jgi:hypothetical protein
MRRASHEEHLREAAKATIDAGVQLAKSAAHAKDLRAAVEQPRNSRASMHAHHLDHGHQLEMDKTPTHHIHHAPHHLKKAKTAMEEKLSKVENFIRAQAGEQVEEMEEIEELIQQIDADGSGKIDWDAFWELTSIDHQRTILVNGKPVHLFTREQLEKKSQPILRDCGLNLQAALDIKAVVPRHSHALVEFVLEMQEQALRKKDPHKRHHPAVDLHPEKLYLSWREDLPQTGTYQKVEGLENNNFPVWRHAYNEHHGRSFPFVMYMCDDGRWRIVDESLNPGFPEFQTPVNEVSSGKVMMTHPVKESLETALAAEITMREDNDPMCPADVKYWITTRTRGMNESPFRRKAGFDWCCNKAITVTREYIKPFGGDGHFRQAINQRI